MIRAILRATLRALLRLRVEGDLAALAPGGRLIVATLDRLSELTLTPQPAEGATYARKVEKSEAILDWTQDAAFLERAVRAFNPFPVAQTTLDEHRERRALERVGASTGRATKKSKTPSSKA